jgi:Transcriptional regulator
MRARPDGDIGSLDIRALRTFVEVTEVGHFARAAKNLGMSPSALSRSIRSLEDWSGVALLVRTSRSADLTPAGQSLLPLAQAILGNLREFRDAAKLAEAGRRGVLDIGFMDVVIADFLPGQFGPENSIHQTAEFQLPGRSAFGKVQR